MVKPYVFCVTIHTMLLDIAVNTICEIDGGAIQNTEQELLDTKYQLVLFLAVANYIMHRDTANLIMNVCILRDV